MKNNDVSIKISSELYRKVKELAKKENCFMTFIFNRAIKNYLKIKKVLEA